MGWSLGYDSTWNRDIGYGVPAFCDHPQCNEKIDRGLSYVCYGSEPYGGDGCGLYFCEKHRDYRGKCPRCANYKPPYKRIKLDHPEWSNHKLFDASWSAWRKDHPMWVKEAREASVKGTLVGSGGE